MRTLVLSAAAWLLLHVFLFPPAVAQDAGRAPSPADSAEQAIRMLLDAQAQAWNRGDLPRYMAGYWQSGELAFFSGSTVTRGWQQTLERYQEEYVGEGREMGRLVFRDLEIRTLSTDAAFARGVWELESKDGKKTQGLFTLLLRKLPVEGWKIVHDHSSAE